MSIANLLLSSLPAKDRRRLLSDCEHVDLSHGEILIEPGKRLGHAFFPTDGFISMMTTVDLGSSLEIGLIGDEGMLGTSLALGVDASELRGSVQGSGRAWRIEATPFRRALARSPALQWMLDRYVYVLMSQLALSAGCTRYHEVQGRLARRLLMTADRTHANELALTQDSLAHMLGVRRVGVTLAASVLRQRKLISYRRGDITILNRRGLEAIACSCYRATIETYEQTMN